MNSGRINRVFSASLMTEALFGFITAIASLIGYEFPNAVKTILLVIAVAALPFLIYSTLMKIKHKV